MTSLDVIHHGSARRADYLYRVSLKCLVRNHKGEVLVVKEGGRDWWDLPGGGMDHGETIKTAIAREMREEVNLDGDFTYRIISVEDPKQLQASPTATMWQMRLIFELKPQFMEFRTGDDGHEVAFKNPGIFKDSALRVERLIYTYACATEISHTK